MMSRKVMTGNSGLSILSPNHPDLLAFYTMEDISGTTLGDDSLASNDATLANITTETGKVGATAIVGNGSTANVNLAVPTTDIETGYTFAAWVKFNGTIGLSTLWSKRDGGNATQFYMNGSSRIDALMWGANQTTTFKSFSPSTGVWYFIALSWDGSDIIIRVDASEQSSTLTGTLDTTNDNARFMDDWNSNLSDISMDQVRIFKRGLTTAELNQMEAEGSP